MRDNKYMKDSKENYIGVTYVDMPYLIKREANFKGNSVTAYHDKLGNYIILSYETEIGRVGSNTGKKSLNTLFYSRTTSRIQRILKDVWGLNRE